MATDDSENASESNGGGTARNFVRYDQTFPELTPQEIDRMRRFGEIRTYKDGERLFEAGKPGRGMFVLLSGHVAITHRDGFGHIPPGVAQGPGQFPPQAGQLSGPVAPGHGFSPGD